MSDVPVAHHILSSEGHAWRQQTTNSRRVTLPVVRARWFFECVTASLDNWGQENTKMLTMAWRHSGETQPRSLYYKFKQKLEHIPRDAWSQCDHRQFRHDTASALVTARRQLSVGSVFTIAEITEIINILFLILILQVGPCKVALTKTARLGNSEL